MTAGDIEPVENCDAAAIVTAKRGPIHPAMWHGIFVHRFLEYYQTKGRDAALRYIARKNKGAANVCRALDPKDIPRGDPEQGFIIDPEAGTGQLAVYADADPNVHIFCKTDLVRVESNMRPVSTDYKTGDRTYNVQTGPQFIVEGVALWLAFDRPPEVGVEVINITIGKPRTYRHNFTADELAQHLARLKRVHAKLVVVRQETVIDNLDPAFTPGEHCRSCRARFECSHAPESIRKEANR